MKGRSRTSSRAQQWGPTIGHLRGIVLRDGSKRVAMHPHDSTRVNLIVNTDGTALLVDSKVAHRFRSRHQRPVRIDYRHAQGGEYHHTFTRHARATVTPRGIVIDRITVKPYIEG